MVAVAAITIAMVGCGSDEDEASAQEQYCEAGSALRSSIEALTSVNLIADGTSGLQDALDAVRDDLGDLADAADSAVESEVDTLRDSVSALQTSVGDLSGDISAENASALGTAVQSVGSSAQAVFATLSDC